MKTKYILGVLISVLLFVSCKGFLDEVPYNKVTQGNYYTTTEGIKGGVNGLYARLRKIYNNEYFMNVCENGTDITIFPKSGGRPPVDPSTGYVRDLWNACYININQCNEVIQALETLTIPGLSESLRERYLGEAKFIRAHLLDHLVKQFGDIHMDTKPAVGIVITAKCVPEAQVWEQIISDLDYAIAKLPAEYDKETEYGRVTKYAAMHAMSKVLLTCKRTDPEALKLAQEYAEAVIGSGKFELFDDTWGLWEMKNVRATKEVIFPVCYSQDALLNGVSAQEGGNQSHMYFVANYEIDHKGFTRSLEYGRPWVRCKPTRYAYELFQNPGIDKPATNNLLDRRAKDWFQTEWKINTGKDYTESMFNPHTKTTQTITVPNGSLGMIACPWYNMDEAAEYVKAFWPVWVWIPDHMQAVVAEQGGIQSASNPNGKWPSNVKFCYTNMYPYIRKHLDPTRLDAGYAQGSRDVFVYRLAETYLLAAEAAFLRGNNSDTEAGKGAAYYLNIVRKRAENRDPQFLDKMKITPAQVTADFILDERGRELIGEMHRWYDLRRFDKMTERMTQQYDKIWYFPPAFTFAKYMEKRPYPRDFLLNVANPQDFQNDPQYGN